VKRRTFLTTAAIGSTQLPAAPATVPVIDTHIHLYDPGRPEGVPWPPKSNTLIYKPTLPARFREVTRGMGVVGAIEVECSPWLEDNQWVLDVAAKDTIIVGTVGNLQPDKPDFRRNLERFSKNPLFRGIRYGYLWDRNPGQAIANAEFIAGLKELARANLVLDTANPSVRLLGDVIRISDLAPDLRIVIDHLPALYPPPDQAERTEYDRYLRELHRRPQVYAKLSAVLRKTGDRVVPYQLAEHKGRLDLLYETFGPDRVLYGSDWPNSDPSAPYTAVLAIVREYFDAKGREAAEKYFWRNSARVYRWVRRDNTQPEPRKI
jgi:predicted TIM-barrel fold metal-dependent hydrolase